MRVFHDGLQTDEEIVLPEGLVTRVRNALYLVRGKPAEGLPSSGRDLAGAARALGHPAGTQGDFLDDYRRATRRARAVVERVFYA